MPSQSDIALTLAVELIRKSGVREWEDAEARESIQAAAVEMAAYIYSNTEAAVANKVLLTEMDGTPKQIWFGSASGNAITAGNDLRDATADNRTFVAITLASLADGAARQSAKVDLGADRARLYAVRAVFELAATPTAGEPIELYWAPSQSATAGTANPANITGTDAAYAGYSANLAASVKQLQLIGHFVCTVQATTTLQVALCGYLEPIHRYGSLVVKNESGAAFHSSDTQVHIVLDPVVDELQ